MIKTLYITIGNSDMEIDVGLSVEDNGIGDWECHGRGYHTQEEIVWDEEVHAMHLVDCITDKKVEVCFKDLKESNQEAIIFLIEKSIEDLNIHDIKQEIKEC
jgi:hypothetical protein